MFNVSLLVPTVVPTFNQWGRAPVSLFYDEDALSKRFVRAEILSCCFFFFFFPSPFACIFSELHLDWPLLASPSPSTKTYSTP